MRERERERERERKREREREREREVRSRRRRGEAKKTKNKKKQRKKEKKKKKIKKFHTEAGSVTNCRGLRTADVMSSFSQPESQKQYSELKARRRAAMFTPRAKSTATERKNAGFRTKRSK